MLRAHGTSCGTMPPPTRPITSVLAGPRSRCKRPHLLFTARSSLLLSLNLRLRFVREKPPGFSLFFLGSDPSSCRGPELNPVNARRLVDHKLVPFCPLSVNRA